MTWGSYSIYVISGHINLLKKQKEANNEQKKEYDGQNLYQYTNHPKTPLPFPTDNRVVS